MWWGSFLKYKRNAYKRNKMTTIDQKPFHRMIIGANKIKKKRT